MTMACFIPATRAAAIKTVSFPGYDKYYNIRWSNDRPRIMAALQALRELLLTPATFFRDRRIGLSLGAAVAVALAVVLVSTVGAGVIGWLLSQQIDATRTVTVAEPMSGPICDPMDNPNTGESFMTPSECTLEEPVTKQVDVGTEFWQEFTRLLPLVFVGGILGWVLVAGGLHLASYILDGEGAFVDTLAVAGWAMVPSLAQTAVFVAAGLLVIPGMEITGSTGAVAQQFRQLSGGLTAAGTVATVLTTVWQAYIWYGGLQVARNLDEKSATLAAGAVAVFSILATLVG
jgi:hypothetical protein